MTRATRREQGWTGVARPHPGIVALGWLLALACVGFAVVNAGFETTGRFAEGPLSEYAGGLTVMNWLVIVLKLVGAGVALHAVELRFPAVPPSVVNVAVWGSFATVGLYALGSVGEMVAIVAGVTGSLDLIDAAGIAYVAGFLLAASGYGILAVSHTRRWGLTRRHAILGIVGGPVVLGSIFLVVPALLTWWGIMPALG
jgi:hypothetical protein